MYRKLLFAAIIVGAVAAPASAQVMIEMSQITCKQYSEYDPETKQFVAAWMSGYFSASKNLNIVELRYVKRNREKVGAYCKKHKNETLFSAIQKNAR